jgi:hypothetical protein
VKEGCRPQEGLVFQGKGREEKKVFEFWLFWPVFEEEFWFLVFDG